MGNKYFSLLTSFLGKICFINTLLTPILPKEKKNKNKKKSKHNCSKFSKIPIIYIQQPFPYRPESRYCWISEPGISAFHLCSDGNIFVLQIFGTIITPYTSRKQSHSSNDLKKLFICIFPVFCFSQKTTSVIGKRQNLHCARKTLYLTKLTFFSKCYLSFQRILWNDRQRYGITDEMPG